MYHNDMNEIRKYECHPGSKSYENEDGCLNNWIQNQVPLQILMI